MFGPNALEASFRKASNEMINLSTDISSQIGESDRLAFYTYYKQATVGDLQTPQPHFLNVKENKKWWAWHSCKGTSKEDSMKQYIDLTASFRLKATK